MEKINSGATAPDCIFCKIARGEIPSEKLYENEQLFIINDINPKAPVHMLIIPKVHIPTLNDLEDSKLFAEIFKAIKFITQKMNVKDYKTLINTGAGAGQIVFHLHVHILGEVSKI